MSQTFAQLQARYQILKGDDSVLTADATGKSHLNSAKNDIENAYPFSWTAVRTTGTLSAGTFALPADYNPLFGVEYASLGGVQLVQKDPKSFEEDGGTFGFYVSAAAAAYTFHCQTLSGTATYYYHSASSDLSGDADVCRVPDGEAVAYLAAAKNWIGSERNVQLQAAYAAEFDRRLKRMIQQDAAFGPVLSVGSVLDYNSLY